jgi:hypothetical protein
MRGDDCSRDGVELSDPSAIILAASSQFTGCESNCAIQLCTFFSFLMTGKTTFMRALLVTALLASCGLCVRARYPPSATHTHTHRLNTHTYIHTHTQSTHTKHTHTHTHCYRGSRTLLTILERAGQRKGVAGYISLVMFAYVRVYGRPPPPYQCIRVFTCVRFFSYDVELG